VSPLLRAGSNTKQSPAPFQYPVSPKAGLSPSDFAIPTNTGSTSCVKILLKNGSPFQAPCPRALPLASQENIPPGEHLISPSSASATQSLASSPPLSVTSSEAGEASGSSLAAVPSPAANGVPARASLEPVLVAPCFYQLEQTVLQADPLPFPGGLQKQTFPQRLKSAEQVVRGAAYATALLHSTLKGQHTNGVSSLGSLVHSMVFARCTLRVASWLQHGRAVLRGEAAIATMESLEMAGPLDMVDSLDIASAPGICHRVWLLKAMFGLYKCLQHFWTRLPQGDEDEVSQSSAVAQLVRHLADCCLGVCLLALKGHSGLQGALGMASSCATLWCLRPAAPRNCMQ